RRFRPRWYAHAFAVIANTSPGDISHSDGHSIFKVQVLLQEQFSEKMRSFPYIQEVGKERKTGWISTLRDRKKEGYAMQVKLTIQERLKDLRVERGLSLEQLAEQTGLSKSALGKYEADDFKDISPFSIVTLAKFYGVSTDYLLGMTETKKHPDTELDALHLSADAIEVLKAGQFNHRLLSEMLCHKDFQRMMLDAEIYVDRIADMRINDMNAMLEAVRKMALMKQDGKNDLSTRTLELAQVREDDYFGHVLADDLKAILRDIREEHSTDTTTADTPSIAEEVQSQLKDAMNFEGSDAEKQARIYLATFGIDYDAITKEQFVNIIDVLKLSKYMKGSTNQRGKARPYQPHGKGKRKRK
ncbi:helix-turn-helix transcriptional regulator, partial [Pseudoflavonifractor capillosus]|uniref:helix-turn-helix domain-containing protein n=1 Tax=Pseudoflavonifractor capillosus TaxID=106588 RepID=UPI002A8058B5